MTIVKRKKQYVSIFDIVLAFMVILSSKAQANLFQWSGYSSVGNPISLEAELTITELGAVDTLTVSLRNTTEFASAYQQVPNDMLGSFYFDILDADNLRPTLTYASATGDVYLNNVLQTSGADLMALVPGDDTWQFKTMNDTQIPYLGFGIGTVGNGTLANSFNGNIVGGINYSIYSDVTVDNPLNPGLQKNSLVKGEATFTFTGDLDGYNIGPDVAFGLGTAPDSIHHAPLPGAILLGILSMSAVGALGLKLRKF
jgi:hypothetical protein